MSAQALAALERANSIRIRRSQLRRELQSREVSLSTILTEPLPEWLENMPVDQLLSAAPRVGKLSVVILLRECGLRWGRPLGLLTPRQRNLLAELIPQPKSGKRARTKFERGVR
jgi:hypothetical protein